MTVTQAVSRVFSSQNNGEIDDGEGRDEAVKPGVSVRNGALHRQAVGAVVPTVKWGY